MPWGFLSRIYFFLVVCSKFSVPDNEHWDGRNAVKKPPIPLGLFDFSVLFYESFTENPINGLSSHCGGRKTSLTYGTNINYKLNHSGLFQPKIIKIERRTIADHFSYFYPKNILAGYFFPWFPWAQKNLRQLFWAKLPNNKPPSGPAMLATYLHGLLTIGRFAMAQSLSFTKKKCRNAVIVAGFDAFSRITAVRLCFFVAWGPLVRWKHRGKDLKIQGPVAGEHGTWATS